MIKSESGASILTNLSHPYTLINHSPPRKPGIYSLLIQVKNAVKIHFRNRSHQNLSPGLYIYVGSAMGKSSTNLANRIQRHFYSASQKKKFWHIDFLLNKTGPPLLCAFAETCWPMECALIQRLQAQGGQTIKRFGSSDCTARCGGHLLFFSSDILEILITILLAYQWLNLTPKVFFPILES